MVSIHRERLGLGSAQAGGLEDMWIGRITTVVLGGTSLFGGKGGIPNMVIELLAFGVLYNGLNHVQMDVYLKLFISGSILLAALVLNVTMSRTRNLTWMESCHENEQQQSSLR